jgi:hypothetical protein
MSLPWIAQCLNTESRGYLAWPPYREPERTQVLYDNIPNPFNSQNLKRYIRHQGDGQVSWNLSLLKCCPLLRLAAINK